MTASVTYHSGLNTTCVHFKSGQNIITDAPPDNHGKGEAFSPTDLAATSLASCMLTTMGIYAKKNSINLNGSHASVTKIMASEPRRISKIIIEINMPESIQVGERKKLEDIAINCPVAKSLHPDIEQDIHFDYKPILVAN